MVVGCSIDAFSCGMDCKKCDCFQKEGAVEIRLFDNETDKVYYKNLTIEEKEQIFRILKIEKL